MSPQVLCRPGNHCDTPYGLAVLLTGRKTTMHSRRSFLTTPLNRHRVTISQRPHRPLSLSSFKQRFPARMTYLFQYFGKCAVMWRNRHLPTCARHRSLSSRASSCLAMMNQPGSRGGRGVMCSTGLMAVPKRPVGVSPSREERHNRPHRCGRLARLCRALIEATLMASRLIVRGRASAFPTLLRLRSVRFSLGIRVSSSGHSFGLLR